MSVTRNVMSDCFSEEQTVIAAVLRTLGWSSVLPLAVDLSQLCIGRSQPGFQRLHPLVVQHLLLGRGFGGKEQVSTRLSNRKDRLSSRGSLGSYH